MKLSNSKSFEREFRIDSKLIYSGQIIEVKVDRVVLPDGSETTREVVFHVPAVVIVPVDKSNNLIMVSQYRYAINKRILEFPAGGLDKDETPEECAQRELREETGFGSKKLLNLGGFWSAPGFLTEYLHVFLALELFPSRLEPDSDEMISICKFSLTEVEIMMANRQIQDSKSVAALYFAMNSNDFPV